MAFGGSQITRERESGQLVSITDDLKSAGTDALKKCARGPAPPPRPAQAPGPPARTPVNGTRPGNGQPGNGQSNGHGNGAATPRQLDAIWKVARAKGLDPGAVDSMSLRVFNRKPHALPTRRPRD